MDVPEPVDAECDSILFGNYIQECLLNFYWLIYVYSCWPLTFNQRMTFDHEEGDLVIP
jgi:hypothetical protein